MFLYTRAYARTRGREGASARRLALFAVCLALLVCVGTNLIRPASTAAASTDNTINFQARLETNTGAIVPDGYYNIEFKLYSVSSGGSAQLTEDYTYNNGSAACTGAPLGTGDCRLKVVNGYFTVNLGSITVGGLPTTINWDQQEYVGMNVATNGTATTGSYPTMGDGEMTPRLLMTAVPYAFRAGQLALLTGANTSTLGWDTQTTANSLLLPNEAGKLCTNATGGVCSGLYIQNQNGSPQSAATFNIASSGQIGTTLVVGGLTTANGGLTVNTAAASDISVTSGSTVPTADQLNITNVGSSGVTAAGVNGLSINYKGGAAAVEAAAERIDLQPGTTTGGTWDAVRLVANATGPATGVTETGLKVEGPTSAGAGIFNAINVANIGAVTTAGTVNGINLTGTNSQAAGTVNAININNLTPGGATETAIKVGTGWDNVLQSANAIIAQNGTLTLGSSSTAATIILNDGASHTITLNAASGVTYNLTLPTAAPAVSQCLQTDASVATQLKFGSCSGAGTTLQGAYNSATASPTPEIVLDSTRLGLDIQDKTGGTIGATQSLLSVRGVGTATTLGASLFTVNASGQVGINNGSTSTTPTLSYDLSFGQGNDRTIGIETQGTTNTNGNNLTVSAGTGNGSGNGGTLNLQGGSASATAGSIGGGVAILATNGAGTGAGAAGGAVTITAGNANGSGANSGGNITLKAGNATGAGANGSVIVKNAVDSGNAFQVQKAGSATDLLNADTANMTLTVQAGTDAASLGSELNVNSNFSTQWTNTGWTATSTTAQHNSGNTSSLSPITPIATVSGSYYQICYTITTPNAGSHLTVFLAATSVNTYSFDANNANTFSDCFTAQAPSTNANLIFTPDTNFTGTISAVSIKQMIQNLHPALVVNNTSSNPSIEVRASGGQSNLFIGLGAGESNSGDNDNTALGTAALQFNTTGTANTAIGYKALQLNTTGIQNAAFGNVALQANTSGSFNMGFGTQALAANTTGSSNVAVGVSALLHNQTGYNNEALGTFALGNNTTGYRNVGIDALGNNTTGYLNVGVGSSSLGANTTGYQNIGIGTGALTNNTTGFSGTAVGTQALQGNITGQFDVGLGAFTDVISSNLNAVTAIGAGTQVGASSNIALGYAQANGVNDKVGIGTSYAPNELTVSPLTYGTSASTASGCTGVTITQTTTAITASSSCFTPAMNGATVYTVDNTGAEVIETVTYGSATTLTASASHTVTAGTSFHLTWGGFNVTNTGTLYLQPTTDSVTAFQVLNHSAGADVFTVDTVNNKVGTANQTVASTNSSNLVIQSGNATGTTSNSGSVSLDSGTATGTAGNVLIGTGTSGAKTIQIGPNATNTSTTTYQLGANSAGIQAIAIGSTGTGANANAGTTVSIQGGTGANAISIGTTSAVNQLLIGSSTAATSTTSLLGGTGSAAVSLEAAGTGTIVIGTTNANTIDVGAIGATAVASTVNLGTSTGATQQVNLGSTGSGTAAAGTLVNIQGGTTANTAVKIGTNGAGGITIDSGSTGIINIGNGAAAKTVIIGSTNTTSKLTLQAGFNTTTTGKAVVVGSDVADANQVNFQLDTDNTFSSQETNGSCAATVNQGAMYYNSASNSIRACDGGSAWQDVVTADTLGIQLFGVVEDSGVNGGDIAGVVSTIGGPCKVSIASALTSVSWTGCTAYSGGRKVIVTAGTQAVTGTAGQFQHLCLNAAGTNQPTLTTANTEPLGQPGFSLSAPILCIADIKLSGTNTIGTTGVVYDTRVFTSSQKIFATIGTTAPALGMLVQSTTTRGVAIPIATLNGGSLLGVVAASSGAISTNTINAIISVDGPVAVKAITGTNLVNDFVQGSATAGYATTNTTANTTNVYGILGQARTPWSGASTCTVSADTCEGSVITTIQLR